MGYVFNRLFPYTFLVLSILLGAPAAASMRNDGTSSAPLSRTIELTASEAAVFQTFAIGDTSIEVFCCAQNGAVRADGSVVEVQSYQTPTCDRPGCFGPGRPAATISATSNDLWVIACRGDFTAAQFSLVKSQAYPHGLDAVCLVGRAVASHIEPLGWVSTDFLRTTSGGRLSATEAESEPHCCGRITNVREDTNLNIHSRADIDLSDFDMLVFQSFGFDETPIEAFCCVRNGATRMDGSADRLQLLQTPTCSRPGCRGPGYPSAEISAEADDLWVIACRGDFSASQLFARGAQGNQSGAHAVCFVGQEVGDHIQPRGWTDSSQILVAGQARATQIESTSERNLIRQQTVSTGRQTDSNQIRVTGQTQPAQIESLEGRGPIRQQAVSRDRQIDLITNTSMEILNTRVSALSTEDDPWLIFDWYYLVAVEHISNSPQMLVLSQSYNRMEFAGLLSRMIGFFHIAPEVVSQHPDWSPNDIATQTEQNWGQQLNQMQRIVVLDIAEHQRGSQETRLRLSELDGLREACADLLGNLPPSRRPQNVGNICRAAILNRDYR